MELTRLGLTAALYVSGTQPGPQHFQPLFHAVSRTLPKAGFAYSMLVHAASAVLAVGVPYVASFSTQLSPLELRQATMLHLNDASTLAVLAGNARSAGLAAPGAAQNVEHGFIYPGLRAVLSNLAAPNSRIQSVVSLRRKSRAALPFTPLPNAIPFADDTSQALLFDLPEPTVAAPVEPRPVPGSAAAEPAASPAVAASDWKDVLSVSPLPGLASPKLPTPGESRGRFAIAPQVAQLPRILDATLEGSLSTASGHPRADAAVLISGGAGANVSPSNAPAPGIVQAPPLADSAIAIAADPQPLAPGIGSTGIPGIRIVGGTMSRRSAPDPVAPQTAYGLTIVSTAGSGGLPDLGYFAQRHVYTVYLDLRAEAGASSPAWVLQYALACPAERAADPCHGADSDAGLVPPFPVTKHMPDFPQGFHRPAEMRQAAVHGFVDRGGNMKDLSVKLSQDAALNAAILAALYQWKFRPGERMGQPVEVEFLLGVPLP